MTDTKQTTECLRCSGAGWVMDTNPFSSVDRECKICGGTGYLPKTEDNLPQAAARAWLHAYGINTAAYTKSGGDHPAMMTLPDAFEAYAQQRMKDQP